MILSQTGGLFAGKALSAQYFIVVRRKHIKNKDYLVFLSERNLQIVRITQ